MTELDTSPLFSPPVARPCPRVRRKKTHGGDLAEEPDRAEATETGRKALGEKFAVLDADKQSCPGQKLGHRDRQGEGVGLVMVTTLPHFHLQAPSLQRTQITFSRGPHGAKRRPSSGDC